MEKVHESIPDASCSRHVNASRDGGAWGLCMEWNLSYGSLLIDAPWGGGCTSVLEYDRSNTLDILELFQNIQFIHEITFIGSKMLCWNITPL